MIAVGCCHSSGFPLRACPWKSTNGSASGIGWHLDYALQEPEVLLPESDVVHLRFRMMTGNCVIGTSPAMLCAPALALAIDARSLQRELLANLNAPLFVMTSPGNISAETANRFQE